MTQCLKTIVFLYPVQHILYVEGDDTHMSLIDKQICDAILDKVSECYTLLSEDVREFMTTEVDEDDILDMLHATMYFKQVIRDRFYMEDTDEHDFEILTIMETLLKLFIDHIDDI